MCVRVLATRVRRGGLLDDVAAHAVVAVVVVLSNSRGHTESSGSALHRDLVLVVCGHVVLQVQLSGEALAAARIGALERLEVGLPVPAQVGVFMGQQVLGKVPPLTELLSADFARKRLLSSVNSHVACEQSLVREALVAVGVGALNKTRC